MTPVAIALISLKPIFTSNLAGGAPSPGTPVAACVTIVVPGARGGSRWGRPRTMDDAQVKRALALRWKGKSVRAIAAELDVPQTSLQLGRGAHRRAQNTRSVCPCESIVGRERAPASPAAERERQGEQFEHARTGRARGAAGAHRRRCEGGRSGTAAAAGADAAGVAARTARW